MDELNYTLTERERLVIEMCLRIVQSEREQENIRFEMNHYDFEWQHKADKMRQNDMIIMELGEMIKKFERRPA